MLVEKLLFKWSLDNEVPIQIIKKLIKAGADPNERDRDGKTAAHRCVLCEDNKDFLNVLIKAKADFSIKK